MRRLWVPVCVTLVARDICEFVEIALLLSVVAKQCKLALIRRPNIATKYIQSRVISIRLNHREKIVENDINNNQHRKRFTHIAKRLLAEWASIYNSYAFKFNTNNSSIKLRFHPYYWDSKILTCIAQSNSSNDNKNPKQTSYIESNSDSEFQRI